MKKKIIQTKIFLFDISKEFIDPDKDLEKICDIMNKWCWKNNIINDDNTVLEIVFGDGVIIGNLQYSKVKTVKV